MRYLAIASLLLAGCHIYQEVGDDPDATGYPVPEWPIDGGPIPPGPSGCGACPAPDPGKISVCGWLRDAETDDLLGTISSSWQDCATMNPRPTSGPCAVDVSFYDALMFAGNPTGSPPLQPSRLTVNTCGRFIAENLPSPALGFMAVGVDDHSPGAADNHVLSALMFSSMSNLKLDDLRVYVVRHTSDDKWTTSAGSPFGSSTFAARGAYLPIFRHRGVPVAGVRVTENGESQPDAYYFSDLDPFERTTIDPAQASTGPNGSALLVDSALVNHSGEGSEGLLEGCVWPNDLADAIPGVYFVQIRDSEDANGDLCQ
jgi:hypothetical protein